MNIVHRIYTVYAVIVFLLLMLILFPFYFLIIQKKSWHKYSHTLNKIWAGSFFLICFMPVKTRFSSKLDKKKSYIYCSNHFSYFDIATMVFVPSDFKFTGKASLTSAPVLGYIFRKLHITVDRFSAEGRRSALEQYYKTLDEGKSLVIFPEGGIYAEKPPQMGEFKHGAFTAAITKKTPIVPVTIPYNWIILPDNGKLLIRRRAVRAIFHEPIETAHLTMDDLDNLKTRVYKIIQNELNKHNYHENRQGDLKKDRTLSQA